LSATVIFSSVLASFFGLLLAVLVFWVMVQVSLFCSLLTWSLPGWLCRAETPWSCRRGGGEGGAS
jgi:hypothetical protein